MSQIKIFDTTLRDGEQSPGCSMNLKEKIEVAKCLERLKVDVIEAGFAISSPGDFESVQTIARTVKSCSVASLARANTKDIDCAWEAVKDAADPRIHVFIATSPLHMEYKLKMSPEAVLEKAAAMVAYAKKYCPNVEFSAEDATRSDVDFLVQVVDAAIRNGATVINLPDTVGYTTPDEMRALIATVIERVPGSDKVEFSVHCHNDLGMATANSLAGVLGGARQIECTINGLGERAGNTSLEEVVMAMHTRPDLFGEHTTGIETTQIYRASKTVYNIIGQTAPINKPIVGRHAFLHAAGELLRCFEEFKVLCDKKKDVNDADLEALVTHSATEETESPDGYKLDWFAVHTSNFTTATSTVCLKLGDEKFEDVCLGDGPVDAAFQAIDRIVKPVEHTFELYRINSISQGKDTLGEVSVKLTAENRTFSGRGLSTDIIEASILAYISAVNKLRAYTARKNKEE